MELDEETTILAKGMLWQNATNIIVKLLAFVYTIIIARFVAQSEVGLFYFALGIVGTVGIFADLGLTTALTRYVPYFIGKKDNVSVQKTVAIVVFGGTILLSVASISTFLLSGQISRFFNNPALEPVLAILAVQLAIAQTYGISNALLFSLKKVRESSVANSLQAFLKLIFMLLLIFSLGANAVSLSIAFMLSYAFAAFYLLFALRKCSGWLKNEVRLRLLDCLPLLRELLPFGIMIVGVMAFSTIIGYSDKLLLGYMLREGANEQIAIYSIATSLSALSVIFSGSLISIFYPVVSGLVGTEDWKKVNKTSQTALKWLLFSSVPIAAFLMAFSAPMLRVLYGASYESGSTVLALFALGTFAGSAGTIQRTALAGMRLVKVDLFCVACGAIVNIILNILLIPPFGINGSAFASLVAFITMSGLNQHYAHKYFGFAFPKSAWKNILAGIIVFCILFAIELAAYPYITNIPFQLGDGGVVFGVLDKFLKLAVLLSFFALGALLYLALINLLRLFEHEDVQIFRHISSKFGFPAWITAFFVRLVFWNQKELH